MIRFSLSGFLCFFTLILSATTIVEKPELEKIFQGEKVTGTFVLSDPLTRTTYVANSKRAQKRFIPASTFKIANSLIGLEVGAVKNVDEVLPYGGKSQPFPEWEKDMNLRDAIRVSNVPVYQELARRIGLTRMAANLKKLRYGNQKIGSIVDQFWLQGPLEISALEQAEFLARLTQEKLPLKSSTLAAVKAITLLESTPTYKLYGKTGWGTATKPHIGWWVGWIERDNQNYSFALNMDILTKEDLAKRIEIGKECLRRLAKLDQ